jgi:hypothetical protein
MIEPAKPATYKRTKSELTAIRKGEAAVARGKPAQNKLQDYTKETKR